MVWLERLMIDRLMVRNVTRFMIDWFVVRLVVRIIV